MLISVAILEDYLKKSGLEVINLGSESGPGSEAVYGSVLDQARFDSVRFLQEDNKNTSNCIFIKEMSTDIYKENTCYIEKEKDLLTISYTNKMKIFDLVQDCISYYTTWDDNLRNAMLSNCTLQELLDMSRDIFGNPLMVDDTSFRILSMSIGVDLSRFEDSETSHIYEHGFHSPEYISKMLESPIFRSITSNPHQAKIYLYDFLAHPNITSTISYEDQILGYLEVIGLETPLTKGLVDLSNHFSRLLSLFLVREPRINTLINKSLGNDLVLEVLNGNVSDTDLIISTLKRAGFHENSTYTIAIFTLDEAKESDYFILQRMSEHFAAIFQDSISLLNVNKIILIVKENEDLTATEKVVTASREFLFFSQVKVGISLPFYDILKISHYYSQALAALRFGRLVDPNKRHCRYDEIIGYDLINHFSDAEYLTTICHPAIDMLAEYDKEKGSALLPTLRVFLLHHGDTATAAEAMYIHRNSLYYRMNQIASITGLDLNQDVVKEHLLISFLIYDLKTKD